MKAIILGSVLLLLLISVAIQGYIMISISRETDYVTAPKNGDIIVTTKGVSAPDFWASSWHIFIGPAIIDLLAMGLLATLYVMT